jgi:hypothetical protein
MNIITHPSVNLIGFCYPAEFIIKHDTAKVEQLLETCCRLVAQGRQNEATRFFKYDVAKQFFANPEKFAEVFLALDNKLQEKAEPDPVLRELFQRFVLKHEEPLNLVTHIPDELFAVIQFGEKGRKELFQGYFQYVQGEDKEAKKLFLEAAELGSPEAHITMGLLYIDDHPLTALKWFQRAKNLGHIDAVAYIQLCRTSEKNLDEVFEGLKNAADQGSSVGYLGIAKMYKVGSLDEPDDKKAFDCYCKAKELMNDHGAFEMAKCYLKGRGTEKNLDEAKTILLDLIWRKYGESARKQYEKNFKSEVSVIV